MSIPVAALTNLQELVTPPEEIKWRAGQKQHDGPCDKHCRLPHAQLAYIDARYAMNVLDTLVGPANWQCLYETAGNGKLTCRIGILVEYEDGHSEWVWKADGAGETDIEGEKGSYSDAFKRALVKWGPTRDLYALKPAGAARQAPVQPPPQRAASAPSQGWDAEEVQTAVGGNDDSCPFHHKAWTDGKYGWYCQSKASNGSPENKNGYCNAKPSKAWMAAHEK